MNTKDNYKVKGHVTIQVFDENMELKKQVEVDNLVVQTGLNWVAARISASPPIIMSYIAIGTGNALPALNQTTLQTEVWRGLMTTPGGAATNNTCTYTLVVPQGIAVTQLNEAGIFDSAAGGTMLSRVTYPTIDKQPTDTVVYLWNISPQ